MHRYRVSFTVYDGPRGLKTEMVVNAWGPQRAKELIQAQYSGKRIVWHSIHLVG